MYFPLQSEQEEKIEQLTNMICSAGRETERDGDEAKMMAKVCDMYLSSFSSLMALRFSLLTVSCF